MEPIKPRRQDLVKVDWKISRECKGLISEYSKYTNYPEDELIEIFINEINKDAAFLEWINNKRFTKRAKRYIANESSPAPETENVFGSAQISKTSSKSIPVFSKSSTRIKKPSTEKPENISEGFTPDDDYTSKEYEF